MLLTYVGPGRSQGLSYSGRLQASLALLVLALAACDTATPAPTERLDERPGAAPLEHDPLEVDVLVADPPTRQPGVDPCLGYGTDPAIRMTNGTEWPGEVVVPDYCATMVANVVDCTAATHFADLGDMAYPTAAVDLRCSFDCAIEADPVELLIVAGYPPAGTEVSIVFVNPCPEEAPP